VCRRPSAQNTAGRRNLLRIAAYIVSAQPSKPAIDKKLDVIYERRDSEPLLLDAYLLIGSGSHPAVVFVHGGGFVTGDKRPCPSYILDPYLEHGYSVFSVNYRLAPQHPFAAATDDIATAIEFVHQHAREWRIDTSRIVLTGESAGGLISGLVGATLPEKNRVAAVIPMCGEVDLELRISEDPCFIDGRMVPRPPGGCISKGLAAFFVFQKSRPTRSVEPYARRPPSRISVPTCRLTCSSMARATTACLTNNR
jgi:acetyl esterase/lipase